MSRLGTLDLVRRSPLLQRTLGNEAILVVQVHAFLWTRAKGMQDLNDLIPFNSGWQLNVATAANRRGQIAGVGLTANGSHAFLLIPSQN